MSTKNAPDLGTDSIEDLSEEEQMKLLKQRARMMGIEFSNNIGMETLKQRIQDKLEGKEGTPEAPADPVPPAPLKDPEAPKTPPKTLRQRLYEENMKLVRIRITCLDPKKKEWPGEIITVANEYLGTVRKFVPFGEVTDNGYHVPYCIYKYLKARKFLNIRTYKDRRNGNQVKIEHNWTQEFAIEVLPQLTEDELAKLATAQTAAGSIE